MGLPSTACPAAPPWLAVASASKFATCTISAWVRPVAEPAVTAGCPGADTIGARKANQAAVSPGLVVRPSNEKPSRWLLSGARPPAELATRPRWSAPRPWALPASQARRSSRSHW